MNAMNHADITAMSFEAALAELETIVTRLEKGDAPLEESIALYERGEALRAHCEARLQQAEAKVEKIRRGQSGAPDGLEPLDVD